MTTNTRRNATMLASALVAVTTAFGQPTGGRIDKTSTYELTPRQQKIDGTVRADRQAGTGSRLTRDNGDLNVSIRFRDALTADQIAAYEANGVSFRHLPSGRIAGDAGIYAAWAGPDALDALADDDHVVSIEPGRPANVLPPLDISRSEVQADVRHATRTWSNFQGNRGRGVTIGVVDTGIDVFHPDFFKLKSVAPYNWIDVDGNGSFSPGTDAVDLNRNGTADSGERLNFVERIADAGATFGVYDCDSDWLYHDANNNGNRDYGTAAGFSESDDCFGERVFLAIDSNGDDRLSVGEQLAPLGQSKVRRVLTGNREYVRGVDLIETPIDTNGHGTSVSSILVAQAAGFGRRFCGIAPEAELVVVDRMSFSGNQQDNYVEMLLWMEDHSARVMLWEFGGWTGQFLDGSSHLEALISNRQFLGTSTQVIPNGNLGGSGRHAQADITPGERAARTFTVPSGLGATGVWVSVVGQADTPTGLLVEMRKGTAGYALLPANGVTTIDGHTVFCTYSVSSRGTYRFDITLQNSDGDPIDSGDWSVRVRNNGSDTVTYHYYVTDNATTWSGGTSWTNPVDAYLVTWPATADVCVGVASYSTQGGDFGGDIPGVVSPFSPNGPRIDGAFVEAIAAPGDYGDVWCGQSQGAISSGAWAALRGFGGTSAAGPHVAGAAALLHEAVPFANAMNVREALFATALQDVYTGSIPNDRWGWGKLRIDDAYYYLAGSLCQVIQQVPNLSPADGESGFDPDQALTLSWAPDQNATSYDLHFGTSNPPERYVPGLNITQMNIIASRLEPDTTYYWQVVASNSCGYVSRSEVWQVSTGSVYVPLPDMQVYQQVLVDNEFVRTPVDRGSLYDYPAAAIGEQAGIIFAIYNEGDADLDLTGTPKVQLSGPGTADFTANYIPPENSIAPENWVPIAITFNPQSEGFRVCTVQISTNDPDGLYQFVVRGLGLPADDGDDSGDDGDNGDDNNDPNVPADNGDQDDDQDGDDNEDTGDNNDDPNEPADDFEQDPNLPTDDNGDDDNGGDNTGGDDNVGDIEDDGDETAFDPNTPDAGGNLGGDDADEDDQDGRNEADDDARETDDDLEDEFIDLDAGPLVPSGLCGFGAGFAWMMCSLAYAGRSVRRRIR